MAKGNRPSGRSYSAPASAPSASQSQSAPASGGGSANVRQMAADYNKNAKRVSGNLLNSGDNVNMNADYNNEGNADLVKWQNQADETKAARFLARLGKQATPGSDSEGYSYHQSPFQNMVIQMDLNKPVYAKLNSRDFNAYVRQTGQTPIYRGWSGKASMDRFTAAKASHTGTGMFGEGYYFGDLSTGRSYAVNGAMSTAALSPAARVVNLSTVQSRFNRLSPTLQSALRNSGATSSHFSNNDGYSQLALKMGYNVIRTDWSYVVLSREAVVVKE